MNSKELVIITGASSGIGKALAQKFSDAGYCLLLLARRIERLVDMKLPNTLCEKVDVTDLKAFQQAVKKAEDTFGPVGCIINNAGSMLLGDMDKQDPKEWKQMIDVNVIGVLNGIKAVVQQMVKRRNGTMINISSIAGRKTFPSHGVYCATKFAVHALTESLREEMADDNVRCITIAPGVVETELLDHTTNEGIVDNYKDWKKNMQVLSPQEVADTVLFAYQQPQHVCIREIVIGPTQQSA